MPAFMLFCTFQAITLFRALVTEVHYRLGSLQIGDNNCMHSKNVFMLDNAMRKDTAAKGKY